MDALQTKTPAQSTEEKRLPPLNRTETEIIDLFVQFSRVLGQPRSVAEIYGLLFASPQPLAMDHLIGRLKLSKGSASQGLKILRDLGAVRPIYVAGDRRVHYEAVAELRKLASQFLEKQILPHLNEGESHLQHVETLAESLPPESREHVQRRIQTLKTWSQNARSILPMALKILGD